MIAFSSPLWFLAITFTSQRLFSKKSVEIYVQSKYIPFHAF